MTMAKKLFHVERQPWLGGIAVRMAIRREQALSVAVNVTLIDVPENELAPQEPMLTLREPEAVTLIDELWSAGVRPSSYVSGDAERQALQAHIADLQRIVNALLPQVQA
jgi:hypothetical protein